MVVIENYSDCINSASDVRLAMNFAISCVSLRDWIVNDYASILPTRVDKKPADYERRLRSQSPDFALVCDMANAWKHVRITRPDRRLSSAQQTKHSAFQAGDPCGLPLSMLVLYPDDETRVPVEPMFQEVVRILRQELHDLEQLVRRMPLRR